MHGSFMHLFIYAFNKYFLGFYNMLSFVSLKGFREE